MVEEKWVSRAGHRDVQGEARRSTFWVGCAELSITSLLPELAKNVRLVAGEGRQCLSQRFPSETGHVIRQVCNSGESFLQSQNCEAST